MSSDASLLLVNGLAVGHMTPEVRLNYIRFVGGVETASTKWHNWWRRQRTKKKSLIDALALAKTANCDPQYLALRDRIANALVSGEEPENTASQGSPMTLGRMGSVAHLELQA
jgi:hypothetical protein